MPAGWAITVACLFGNYYTTTEIPKEKSANIFDDEGPGKKGRENWADKSFIT